MSELKPCPFCGGEARIYMNDSDLDNILYYCMCTNDNGCDVQPYTLDHYTEAEAAAAWNTRHVETCKRVKRGTKMDGSPKLRCSECGYGIGDKRWLYCPNCGRKVVSE